jgi:hypothetical protein
MTSAAPDLDALDKLLAAAPMQPWSLTPNSAGWQVTIRMTDGSTIGQSGDNAAALIVAAVNSLPALIARVRRLEAAAQRYLDYTGEHHWRCEHRTAAVGWKEGEPPVIQCVCGRDALRAALDAQPPNPDRLATEAAMIAGLIEDADRDRAAEGAAQPPREPQG